MSVYYRCRLCLGMSSKKIDIFKDDFPKMIEMLTGLKVDPCDDFPKVSCVYCAKNVKMAVKTRFKIVQSHKALLEEFLSKCRENKICKSETIKAENCVNNEEKPDASQPSLAQPERSQVPIMNSAGPEDSNSENSASSLSPAFSDSDWPAETKPTVPDSPGSPEESHRPTLKATKEVIFVKKRKKLAPNGQAEIVVRIKKKPKGREPPKRVTCDICKREVQSYWLQKHLETHEYNPVTCEFCGLVSKSPTALRHHVFYYHRSAADEYMCDQCGRSFRSKYRLNLHKKKEHGGTKDFECTTCGKKFFERMHLKRHVDKTHKNIRPYVCDFCGKSFKSKNHIKIHERIHSKETPYNCHMCGESFKMKLTLRTHLKGVHNVHEEQKVFCDICKRGFVSEVALKAHLNSRIHETEKCLYCSEMFTRDYMINHLRDEHGTTEAS
uniref:Protein krueppel n=1 Tax=Dendroctonus ponderosae TaxID=77166 RepID=A0AAR5PKG9_DENPD